MERLLIPFRFSVSAIQLPFLLTGMLAYALVKAGSAGTSKTPGTATLTLIGVGVLALPILLVIGLVRSMMGG